jgi:tetratricopeptide (TPR) repeat protein
MSIENGKCPSCGGALLLDSSKEKVTCKFCGHEIAIQQAVQKCTIDGIAGFDTKMLKAQQALEFDEDFDKAAKYYREALELKPDDYKALWGAFLCEVSALEYAKRFKGYVQIPGDIPQNTQDAIRKFGNRAYNNAPDDIKPYYYREIQNAQSRLLSQPEKKKKKGCYIATSVYGSYDCPQVWVLRRYRDYSLDKNIFGKLFIRIYYALSPTVVKLFGKKNWFNKFWKKRLDKKVLQLKNNGYADTPYDDLI